MENIKSVQSYYEGEDWCICGACGNLIKNYRMETLTPDQIERFMGTQLGKIAEEIEYEVRPTGGPYCMDPIECASRGEWRAIHQND